MAVSPATAEGLAQPVRDLYAAAELELLGHLARIIGQDIDSPSRWAGRRVRVNGDLRSAIDTTSAALRRDATRAVDVALLEAYDRGRRAAVTELGHLDATAARAVRAAGRSDEVPRRLAAAVERDTRPLYRRIISSVSSAYREIAARVAASASARRAAAQQALDTFAGRGITGLIDPHGRSWSMTSYADMTVRSAAGRAVVDGGVDLLRGVGLGLVVVSNSPLECPLCRPWESKILTLDAAPGSRVVQARPAVGSQETVPVRVAGSLDQARAAGLYHPHCRHDLRPFLPGVTRPAAPAPEPARATYEDTQEQRRLERQLRAWQRREAVALDETARRRARASIGAYQLRLAALSRRTGLPRRLDREQTEATA